MPDPAAIILAAGQSRRFGADKLLARLERDGRDAPLIVHTLFAWLNVFHRVAVVVRPDSDTLKCAVMSALAEDADRLVWIVCPTADHGMGNSLAAGVAACAPDAGWLIGLADMPAVPPVVIAQIRQAIIDGATLAAPVYDGRRGHPVGFAATCRAALLALEGDHGARALIEQDAGKLLCIETTHAGVLTDIDTPADLISFNF